MRRAITQRRSWLPPRSTAPTRPIRSARWSARCPIIAARRSREIQTANSNCNPTNRREDNLGLETNMNTLYRLLALALFSLAASAVNAAEPTSTGAPAPTPPIPTLHCEIKAVMVCTPDGSCKPGTDAAGMTLPLKITVDFENSVVAAADDTGYARTDKFDTVAD